MVRSHAFADLLIREKMITPDQLRQAAASTTEGGCIVERLSQLGYLDEMKVLSVFSRRFKLRMINLDEFLTRE